MDARPDVFTNLKKPTRLLFNRLKLLSWFNNMYISISDETFEPFSFFQRRGVEGLRSFQRKWRLVLFIVTKGISVALDCLSNRHKHKMCLILESSFVVKFNSRRGKDSLRAGVGDYLKHLNYQTATRCWSLHTAEHRAAKRHITLLLVYKPTRNEKY